MPAEWQPHARTWMSWPTLDGYVRTLDEDGSGAWAATANALVGFEPVTMLVPPGLLGEARTRLDPRVELVECELDDAWLRDNGPTFTLDDGADSGVLGAVHWRFNGWGAGEEGTRHDAAAGGFVAGCAGAGVVGSALVNEGGAIAVDGEGTVIVTESVQLHDARNPGWTREEVEAELRARLGVEMVIWLPQGLTLDMHAVRPTLGTNGHVDIVAAFARPGLLLVHRQPDPAHPDAAVMAAVMDVLRSAVDARGRRFSFEFLDAPHGGGGGELHDHSYVNFAWANGGLVMGAFGDEQADAAARAVFERVLPGRRVTAVDARPIFAKGGGVHCITQHQPASRSAPAPR